MWTAGCCVWKDKDESIRAQSIAVMGNNTPYEGEDKTTGMTLKDFEKLLGNNVNLFPGEPTCRDRSVIIEVEYVVD